MRKLAQALLLLTVCLAIPARAIEDVVREVLPNGMSVIIKESHGSPTVSLNVFVKAGSMYETPETSGLSHFYEHMFFRGTPTRTGWQFKRSIESLGGTTNASTGRDFTHYYINLPAQYAPEGLELLADALKNAELKPEGIDLEREAVMEEYRLGNASATRVLFDKMFSLTYGEHPYVRPIIGTEANLKRFSRPDFVAFKARFYVPQRTSLIVVGDVDAERLRPVIRKLFGDFQGGNQPDPRFDVPPWPTEEVSVIEAGSLSRAYVLLGFRGPSVKDRPDIYQVDVMSFLLGMGRGSMLSKALVDARLADQVTVDFLTQREPGMIIVVAVGDPSNEAKMKQIMIECLDRLRKGDFTDAELKRAKVLLNNTYTFGNETNSGKADSLGFYESIDKMDFAVQYLSEIRKVDRKGIMAAANRYFTPGFYSLVARPDAGGGGSR
ncbi:MAG: pitrilysin family protein [Candidatus Eremiobacterota bacterium]